MKFAKIGMLGTLVAGVYVLSFKCFRRSTIQRFLPICDALSWEKVAFDDLQMVPRDKNLLDFKVMLPYS